MWKVKASNGDSVNGVAQEKLSKEFKKSYYGNSISNLN